MTNQPPPEMNPVDLKCSSCGADLPLYHDGVTHSTIAIACKCGKTNTWTFRPTLAESYPGFGVFSAPTLGVGFTEPWVVVTEDEP